VDAGDPTMDWRGETPIPVVRFPSELGNQAIWRFLSLTTS